MEPKAIEPQTSGVSLIDLFVIGTGILTSILTLGLVTLMSGPDSNIMGWYAFFIIPAGAILVGIAAGSGYGFASWKSGRKISGALLGFVLVLQVGAYCGAQWMEFQNLHLAFEDGTPVPFTTYFDVTTRSMTFKAEHSSTPSSELGAVGYVFRGLELLGFSFGGLVVPLALRNKAYCERCRRYMKNRVVGLLPAAVPSRKIPKKDAAATTAFQQEMEQAFGRGIDATKAILEAGGKNDGPAVRDQLAPHATKKKESAKLLHRIQIALDACPRCSTGILSASLLSGHGKQMQTKRLGAVPVTPAVTRTIA